MFGVIFYVYKKEVQKMNDLIELKLITREDAECMHKLQIEAFMPLYENIRMVLQVRRKKVLKH